MLTAAADAMVLWALHTASAGSYRQHNAWLVQVQSCKRNMNTFAFVGDLEKSPEVSCVYHSEDAENAFLKDPKSARLGDGFRARPGFEPINSEPLSTPAAAAAAKAAS